MNTGLPLFDLVEGPAATRRAAGESIAGFAGDHRQQVLEFIWNRGPRGATDEEISEALGLKLDTSRARRCELRDAGEVIDGGGRRRTHSGRLAVCWIVAGEAWTTGRPAIVDRPPTQSAAPPAEPAAEPAAERGAVEAPASESCPKCGAREFRDVPIHHSRSTRRECAKCGAFIAFTRWHGSPVRPKRAEGVMARRAAGGRKGDLE